MLVALQTVESFAGLRAGFSSIADSGSDAALLLLASLKLNGLDALESIQARGWSARLMFMREKGNLSPRCEF